MDASGRIGLYPRLAAVAYHVEAAEYVDPTGRTTCRLAYARFARLAGGKVLVGADGLLSAVRARVFGPEGAYLRPPGHACCRVRRDRTGAAALGVRPGTSQTGIS